MFAYVKFVEGPHSGSKVKINVENIRHNFENANDFDRKKKYFVKYKNEEKYYKAQIIFLEDSMEELEKTINSTKQRLVPTRSCVTTDTESDRGFAKTKSVLTTKDVNKLNSRSKDGKISVEDKFLQFKKKIDEQKSNKVSKVSGNSTNNNLNNSAINCEINNVKVGLNSNELENEFNSTVKNVANAIIDAYETKNENNVTDKGAENEKEELSTNNNKNISYNNEMTSNVKESSTSKNIVDNISNTTLAHHDKAKEQKIKIVDDRLYNPKCKKGECKKEMAKLEETFKELQKKYKKCVKDKSEIKDKYNELKIEMEKLQAEKIQLENKKKEYEELNIALQKKHFEKRSEEEDIQGNMAQSTLQPPVINQRLNFVAVGRIRTTDNTVHVGHGKWIPKTVFDNVMRSQKPTTCVNNILITIFDLKDLLTSTITGNASNASSSKDKDPTKKPQKLDASLIKLCQEWFWHWLNVEYSQMKPTADLVEEYNNFIEIASKKIAYMKRSSQPSSTKRVKKGKLDSANKKGKKRTAENQSSDDLSALESENIKKKKIRDRSPESDDCKNSKKERNRKLDDKRNNSAPDHQIAGSSKQNVSFIDVRTIQKPSDDELENTDPVSDPFDDMSPAEAYSPVHSSEAPSDEELNN